jgi:hypothetical protein
VARSDADIATPSGKIHTCEADPPRGLRTFVFATWPERQKMYTKKYLEYLDKEMTIMGILSAVCVAAPAGILNAVLSKDSEVKALCSKNTSCSAFSPRRIVIAIHSARYYSRIKSDLEEAPLQRLLVHAQEFGNLVDRATGTSECFDVLGVDLGFRLLAASFSVCELLVHTGSTSVLASIVDARAAAAVPERKVAPALQSIYPETMSRKMG